MVTNGKAHDTDRQALAQVVKALVDRSEGRMVAAVGDVLAKDRKDRDELREQLVKVTAEFRQVVFAEWIVESRSIRACNRSLYRC